MIIYYDKDSLRKRVVMYKVLFSVLLIFSINGRGHRKQVVLLDLAVLITSEQYTQSLLRKQVPESQNDLKHWL